MARRLGVSPGPVTVYGPPMATALTAALPWYDSSFDSTSPACRGLRIPSGSHMLRTNDTPTVRGPASTGTRTSSRSSAVCRYASHSGAPRSAMVNVTGAGRPRSSPPTVKRFTSRPSIRTSS